MRVKVARICRSFLKTWFPHDQKKWTWSINLRWTIESTLQKTMKIMKLYMSAVKEDMKARHRCKTIMETTPLKHIIIREHFWSLTTRDAFSQRVANFKNSTIHKSCNPGPHRNVSHAGRPLLVRPHARCVRRCESLRLGTPAVGRMRETVTRRPKTTIFFVETYSNNGILIYSWHHFAIWW